MMNSLKVIYSDGSCLITSIEDRYMFHIGQERHIVNTRTNIVEKVVFVSGFDIIQM